MKSHMRLPLLLIATAFLCAMRTSHAAVEVRCYPPEGVWLHDIDAARQLTSAVIHNTALINRGEDNLTVKQARFEVVRAGRVVASQVLSADALERAAQRGARMQATGLLEALSFQFAPQSLLGKDVRLAATRRLSPHTALLITSQLLVFTAPADEVRIRVGFEGTAAETVAVLPIRGDAAPRAFHFPLQGRWLIGAGATPHNHHRWTPAEEFALDISRVGASGGTYANDGTAMRDYYGWGASVLAAADGEVVAAVDKYPDNTKMLRGSAESIDDYRRRLFASQDEYLAGDIAAIAGNHIVLQHSEDLYSVYAHLQHGSITVDVGRKVTAGTVLGNLGSSGNSTEPHLHFHVCDAPHPLNCAGIPVRFDNIEIPWAERERQLQTGDLIETR